jgi:hypothetical protein
MGKGRKPLRKQPCRLNVELLEDRSLLSVFGSVASKWTQIDSARGPDRESDRTIVQEQRHIDVENISRDSERDLVWSQPTGDMARGNRWQFEDGAGFAGSTEDRYSSFKGVDEYPSDRSYNVSVEPSSLEQLGILSSTSFRSDVSSLLDQYQTNRGAQFQAPQQAISEQKTVTTVSPSTYNLTTVVDIDFSFSPTGTSSTQYDFGSADAESFSYPVAPTRVLRSYVPARDEITVTATAVPELSSAGVVQKIAELISPAQDRRPLLTTPTQAPTATVLVTNSKAGDNLVIRPEAKDVPGAFAAAQTVNGQSAALVASPRSSDTARDFAAAAPPAPSGAMGPQLDSQPLPPKAQVQAPEVDLKQAAPMLAGVLGDIIRVDARSLEQGMQQLLQEFDAAHGQVVLQAAEAGWVSWVAPALAVSIATMEITRRRLRRTSLELAAGAAEDTTWSWFFGADEPGPEERS